MTPEERIKLTNSLSLKDLEFILVTRVQDIKLSIGSFNETIRSYNYSDGTIRSIYMSDAKTLQMTVGYTDEYR